MGAASVTDDSFETDVLNSDKPVLVDFWAEWCAPCRQMAPHLDAYAEEAKEAVSVYKMNVEENPMSPSKYGVRGLPTLIVFKDGKVKGTFTGPLSRQRIAEFVKDSAGA